MRDCPKKLACFIIFIFSFYIINTCAEDKSGKASETGGKSVLKAIHSSELRQIMQRLNSLAYEREYTQLELDRLRARHIESLVETVNELVQTAEKLPEITQGDLSENDQVTFKALANQLYTETVKLQDAVKENNYSDQNAGYQRLRKTCSACHNLYRDW
jgi:cytochrome c556